MSVTLAAMMVWLAITTMTDLIERRIPNLLSIGAFVIAILVMLAEGKSAGGGSVSSALLAAGLAILLTLPAYIGGILGAGDVKLAVSMGFLSDVATLGEGFVIGSLLAGLWAGLWLVSQRSTLLLPWLYGRWCNPSIPAANRRHVPFGAALCIGFAITLLLRGVR